jgi:hypothetical protein
MLILKFSGNTKEYINRKDMHDNKIANPFFNRFKLMMDENLTFLRFLKACCNIFEMK